MIGNYFVKTDSSAIAAVKYIPKRHELDVRFNSGHVYRYFNVPFKIYAKLLAAESVGKFFTSGIRNDYEFEKLE